MKGRVAKKNVKKTLNSVFESAKEEMRKVSPDEWAAAVRLAVQQEDMYATEDQLDPSLEPKEDEEITIEEVADEELKCDNCDYNFISLGRFERHKKAAKNCENCSKVFCGPSANRELKSHILREHTYKPKSAHVCNHCKKPFGYPSQLKHHMLWSACGRQ